MEPHEQAAAGDVTTLLRVWSDGDTQAFDRLIPLVYDELHRMALRYLAGERSHISLQATALVNEVCLRLLGWDQARWQNRDHFFGVSAQMMRRVLVDIARRRRANRRGGPDAMRVPLDSVELPASERDADLVAIDARSRSWRPRMPARPASWSFDFLAGCRWRRRRGCSACRFARRTATGRSPAPGCIASFQTRALYERRRDGSSCIGSSTRPGSCKARTAYELIARSCGTDDGLRAEALSLLEADAASGEFLLKPALHRLAETLAAERWSLHAGELIGPYTIVQLLGSGGAGEVWRARDERLGRNVAIKVLLPHCATDRDRLRRFAEESRTAGALNHSNTLTRVRRRRAPRHSVPGVRMPGRPEPASAPRRWTDGRAGGRSRLR